MADTTVTTLNFWGEEAPGYYSSAFSEYEQLNPGIKIVYHLFPSDAFDTVIASHMATHDSSYAVYEVDEPRTLEFANKGWLVPMDAATMADLDPAALLQQEGSGAGRRDPTPEQPDSRVDLATAFHGCHENTQGDRKNRAPV
jgi:ABC-type glycerol-3-phosphate transport system substrate-binding protein